LSYTTTLDGTETLGTPVIQLRATDGDATPPNSLISYRLVVGGPLFAVDARSGWLSVAAAGLDQVEGPLTLSVVAEDYGVPRLSTATTVIVNVLSRRPRITSPPHNATIPVQQVVSY